MQALVCELKKLVSIFGEIKKIIESGKFVNLSYEIVEQKKTKRQLGYFFGWVVEDIQKEAKERDGVEYSKDFIKKVLYEKCSTFAFTFLGGEEEYILTISEMTSAQMANFVQNVLQWCDDNDVTLRPEAYFTWLNWLNLQEIEEIADLKLPEKSPEYLSHLRHSHCLICGKYGCEPHHTHVDSGLGSTLEDWKAVPLCSECHRNQDGAHITTAALKEKTKYLPWDLGEKTILKLMYDRWQKHL